MTFDFVGGYDRFKLAIAAYQDAITSIMGDRGMKLITPDGKPIPAMMALLIYEDKVHVAAIQRLIEAGHKAGPLTWVKIPEIPSADVPVELLRFIALVDLDDYGLPGDARYQPHASNFGRMSGRLLRAYWFGKPVDVPAETTQPSWPTTSPLGPPPAPAPVAPAALTKPPAFDRIAVLAAIKSMRADLDRAERALAL